MLFASIYSIKQRTNPWNFGEKILRIGGFEKMTFFESTKSQIQKFKNVIFSFIPIQIRPQIHRVHTLMPFYHCHKPVFTPKMAIFQRAGMREGGLPLPLAFQYLILLIWRPYDLNLVMISWLTSKCQHFKVGMSIFQPFYRMKLKTSKFKVLAFWSQWRYHDQI